MAMETHNGVEEALGSERVCGRVIQVLGPQWVVSTGSGAVRCVARRSLLRGAVRPTVGDHVVVERVDRVLWRIVEVLPRRNQLRRASVRRRGRRDQVVAANVDQLLIVGSVAQPGLNPGLMDRYLVAAWRDDIEPVVCFTKVDLGVSARAQAVIDSFEGLGVPLLRTSAVTGEGLDALTALMVGKTTALAGLSGTGKTTLARHLTGDSSLVVGEVSAATGRGRHVTSSARLLPLECGDGYLIDLPGQRVFGLINLTPQDLLRGFPDLERAGRCALPDCRHRGEPGCVLEEAVARGDVPRRRLEAFRRIWRSLEEDAEPGSGW